MSIHLNFNISSLDQLHLMYNIILIIIIIMLLICLLHTCLLCCHFSQCLYAFQFWLTLAYLICCRIKIHLVSHCCLHHQCNHILITVTAEKFSFLLHRIFHWSCITCSCDCRWKSEFDDEFNYIIMKNRRCVIDRWELL